MSDGKWAEAQVQATLKSLSAELGNFDWQRLYDAHSAGGRIPCEQGSSGSEEYERSGGLVGRTV